MMRVALALTAVLPALLLAGAASAQTPDTANGRIELAGMAPAACVIRPARAGTGTNATFSATGSGTGEIQITNLVDAATAQPRQAQMSVILPVICNAAHRVTITSLNGGLLRTGGNARNRQNANGFGDVLGYRLSADWADRPVTLDTNNTTSVAVNVPDGAAGDMALVLNVPPGGGPLTAGRYADTVIVELQVSS